jgi:hypothetical protein
MPEVAVQNTEFYRLLGYPRGKQPEDRAAELAAWARGWYTKHGNPWTHQQEAAMPSRAFLVAVSAGPELEEEAQRRWRDGHPDEYFFLEMYGSAVVEHLTTAAGAQLCEWADPQGLAILPHYSPGYPGFDIAEQSRLLQRIQPLPHPLEVLPSGMLRPKKSQISVFPVVPKSASTQTFGQTVPCTNCTFSPCQYRRVQYRVNRKALTRWAADRLKLERQADGTIDARFRYEGTTCTNLGYPLRFDYAVKLGSRDQAYPILSQTCTPADEGYRHMCRYQEQPVELMQAIAGEASFVGRPLHEAVAAPRPEVGAGCYCDEESRAHKWGLVFETIHYALNLNIP